MKSNALLPTLAQTNLSVEEANFHVVTLECYHHEMGSLLSC